MKRLLLIDGMGLIFRSFYALISRPLINSEGMNTSAIFGTVRIILQLIRDYKPQYLAVAFDVSRKNTFRTELYPEYKAHREEAPPDLKAQIPHVRETLEAMGIPVISQEGFEADDIIGTFCEKLKGDYDIRIVSSDKDLMQLVDDKVRMIRPGKGNEVLDLDPEGVRDKLGIDPAQVVDYLAIVGDKSDNIPGIKGLGEKGAQKLLSEYTNIEEIYDHIDEISGAAQKKLIENKENAFLSKKLATIRRDMNIDPQSFLKELDMKAFGNKDVVKRMERYEFKSILSELEKMVGEDLAAPGAEAPTRQEAAAEDLFSSRTPVKKLDGRYERVISIDRIKQIVNDIQKAGFVSVDTETTSSQPVSAEIVGVCLSIEEKTGYYIPLRHNTAEIANKDAALSVLKPMLEDDSVRKIGQNIKYEVEIFRGEGIELGGVDFDTMIASYLAAPGRSHHNMDSLAEEHLQYQTVHFKEVVPRGTSILDADPDLLADYGAEDADITLRLMGKLAPLLKQNKLEDVFREIELPLIPVLADMELMGVKLDTEHLVRLSKELMENLIELEKEIYHLAGREFNINSPSQLGKILFDKLGLPVQKKTATGKPSTDEEVLHNLSHQHPLPEKIVTYRTYAKLKNTYVDTLPKLIEKKTERVHSSFNQTVAATGRLSSSDPNLQNIPIRDKLGEDIGKRIRQAFVADEGNVILSADYSQVELRVLAHFAEAPTMREAFAKNADIHRHTASLVFGIGENEVSPEQRAKAKSVNFGIIYGLQAYGLSRQLGIPVQEAKEFIDSYYKSFPEVRGFMNATLEEVCRSGEARTMFGRYRRFPSLRGKKRKDSQYLNQAERMAINTRIQGTAADIMKLAMITIDSRMKENFPKAKMLMQIHDELVFEVPLGEAKTFAAELKGWMEHPLYKGKEIELKVPLTVDIGWGANWAEAH